MAQFLKPSNLNNVWASGGDRIYPGDTKYATGWQVEIPPRQYFNEIDYKQDQMLAHLNQHGIPVWDNETEYQADRSYVQGSTGTIYRCVLTHTNQNPDLDVSNTYWIIAFASAGDFYTKTETDNHYLAKSQNLADIPNAATARTSLGVYSRAETYTRTEVDAKTTVASTAQAQAWASNTTLLTPLRLAEAFKGANQSLTATGWQKLPGGLIIQWGRGAGQAAATSQVITLPVTFPSQILQAFVTILGTSAEPGENISSLKTGNFTTSQFTIYTGAASPAVTVPRWFVIGF